MITDLRFIERDGEMVLQMLKAYECDDGGFTYTEYEWQDVPLVKEGEDDS